MSLSLGLAAALTMASFAAPGGLAGQDGAGSVAAVGAGPGGQATTSYLRTPSENRFSDALGAPYTTRAGLRLTPPPVVADTPVERRGPSPMGAFFRSVLVPGWGQFYADQPVRGVIYLAVQSANVFMIIKTDRKIDDTDNEDLKEARRDQREDWLVFAAFWALASGVDAWVSAQMWGFEGEVVPPPDGSAGAALQFSVPVGGF